MNKNELSHKISSLSIGWACFLMLLSCSPWFMWNTAILNLFAILIFISTRFYLFFYKHNQQGFFLYKTSVIWLFIFICWMCLRSGIISGYVTLPITRFLPLFFITCMSDKEKILLKERAIVMFSILLTFSIIWYCLFLLSIPLPNTITEDPAYGAFRNYYLFVVNTNVEHWSYFRFSSIFKEPGYVGMISALFLYIERYNYKRWRAWVLTIALFLSLSLAAYVLFFLGWIINFIAERKSLKIIIAAFLTAIVVFVVVDRAIEYDKGTGLLTHVILERLAYDEEKGIAGNNRNNYEFDEWYDNYKTEATYLVGISLAGYQKLFPIGNSSYKVFIAQYGIIGLLLLSILFLSYVFRNKNRLGLGMFILFAVSFVQRPYILWEAQSFMFICAVVYFNNCSTTICERKTMTEDNRYNIKF